MIVQIRIDDRLIHGQVALVWSKELSTPGIIVADDDAANKETVKMTLKMACPPGIKLIVKSVKDAPGVINDPRAKDMRIFGLTKTVTAALELVKACGDNVQEVNLANCGIFDGKLNVEKTTLNKTVRLTSEQLEASKELAELMGDKFFNQLIPQSAKTPISELLKKL